MIDAKRPPVVTDTDRQAAIAQCPDWAEVGNLSKTECNEIVDDGAWLDAGIHAKPQQRPNWTHFVDERIEQFEAAFGNERCSSFEWAARWKGWFMKTDVRKRFPKSAPKEFHPFFRKGSIEFGRAVAVGTAEEKYMWIRFGIAQFKPDDPRLKNIREGSLLTETSKRMAGEAA